MKRFVLATALFILLIGASTASAGPLVPYCPGGLQSLPSATFNGTPVSSGIPNSSVCTATIGDLTLGFAAHGRFANPLVTNNGVDTFYAGTGDDTGQGQPNYALWNFDWHGQNNSTSVSYYLQVLWDTNPGNSTDVAQFGFGTFLIAPGQTLSNSWNLGMGFIDTGIAIPGYSPAAGLFSPYATGQYGFAVNFFPITGGPVNGIGGFVEVNGPTAVPEPTTLGMMGFGLIGLAAALRRQKRGTLARG